VLIRGGRAMNQRVANKLNKKFQMNKAQREWGRALEDLKGDYQLRNDDHGTLYENGDYVLGDRFIANIMDYVP
jgi:hypothetical protein